MLKNFAVLLAAWVAILPLVSCGGLLPDRNGSSRAARPAPHFKPGFNLFRPEQDVELGKMSAQQIARQVPLLGDDKTVNYIRQLGAKLASKAAGERFPYQFQVVATREVNAFALPGGFIFVYAGAIQAAKNEGELAGVMAHEIVHVALRHGTNQASKAYLAKAGLGILGALAGGAENPDLTQVVNTIGGAGANMIFLKFGRTAEKQADLEGARIMAEAGYDPRDMASFFKTLQEKSGQRVPEFLSDHPDPGNRIAAINAVTPSLPVSPNPTRNSAEFQQIKARLTGGAAGVTSSLESPERRGPRNPDDIEAGATPEPPATGFKQFQSRDGSFSFEYPQNWDTLSSDESNMIFAPKGAYGQINQSVVVTHGLFAGTLPPEGNDLEAANIRFIKQQLEANPDFRIVRDPQSVSFSGRQGFATVVAGSSVVTGVVEVDVIYTTATADGKLFYLITMAPEDELKKYQPTFERIISTLRFK